MIDVFVRDFRDTFWITAGVFLVIVFSGAIVRRKIITQQQVNGLAVATVRVFLPCLTFSNIVRTFDPKAMPFWWTIPVGCTLMVFFGLGIGVLAFIRDLPGKKNLLPISSMQNAGYLILPLGDLLFPEKAEEFRLYCFLYFLVISIAMWSIGKVLTTGGKTTGWRDMLTPPFFANILGLLFVFTGIRRFIPECVDESLNLLGSATVPVALFVLGSVLGTVSIRIGPYVRDALIVIAIKLVIIPVATILVLLCLRVGHSHPMLASFFVIQSAAAPATAHVLQLRAYGGDEQKIGGIMLYSYIVCIFAMPFWLSVWRILGQ